MLYKFKKLDWPVVFILILFMIVSTIVVRSATYQNELYHNYDVRNVINYALGFLILFGAVVIDYRIILKGSLYIYLFGVALLVAVYFYGKELNSAKGWFSLPLGLNFQPAELMKLILIITVSQYLSKRDGEPLQFVRDIVPIGFIVFIPFALVLIQPDLGNAVIYLVILIGMLWIGNVKYSHVLIGIAAAAAFIALFLYTYHMFHAPLQQFLGKHGMSHWVDRIDTFLDPSAADPDKIYQLNNSLRAIGSGALFGEGYLKGQSAHNGFIPYAYSDSIFVVVAEEFGFIGSSVVLLLYFLLIYRMILISIQCYDQRGAYAIVGIVSMFVFQIFQNIGMLTGIMPITGITLPFVSYGGTSLLINMMSIGFVMSIRVHQEKYKMS